MLKRKTILIVFGTRPEAIKMAPLVKEFEKHKDVFRLYVCVTGQHREMLDQVLNLFHIEPDYDLNIMKQGQDLFDITSSILLGMRDVLAAIKPDLVLVHGDTATSTSAALAAFYQQIPVGHIEAGLRTHNIYSPWPEEMNRQITTRIAAYHFAPTLLNKKNLLQENIFEDKIIVTGNTVIDALYLVVKMIENDDTLESQVVESIMNKGYDLSRLRYRRLVLMTGHRRENFGEGLDNICNALKTLAESNTDVDFVYPMHLNPNVRKPIERIFGNKSVNNIFFIEPLDYLPFVYLMKRCTVVLTDSGGIQEEAPGLGKPVLVMRDTTERPEALAAGTVELVGANYEKIVSKVSQLLNDTEFYSKMSKANNPYGDGFASKKIVKFIQENL